jgi:hypothetical protein
VAISPLTQQAIDQEVADSPIVDRFPRHPPGGRNGDIAFPAVVLPRPDPQQQDHFGFGKGGWVVAVSLARRLVFVYRHLAVTPRSLFAHYWFSYPSKRVS